MIYKVNDFVFIKIETLKDGKRKIFFGEQKKSSKVKEELFQIIAIDSKQELYKLHVDDGVSGWIVSTYHVKHYNVDMQFIGKRFYDVPESLVLRKQDEKTSKTK